MKRALSLASLISALALTITTATTFAEPRKFDFNAEAWMEGDPPKEVFLVEGKFAVVSPDGKNKALQIETGGELTEACALVGDSANGSASIETRVFATKMGRSFPRFSIGVHGQSGYRLVIFPAKKEIQLTKSDEVIKTAPLEWTSGAWTKVKLDVKKVAEKQWTITAKVWPADATEPKDAQITHEDPTLKGQGKCSLWGTPFSNTPILFDDIHLEMD